jgi:protoporphyrinogen oxidase
MQWGVVGGGMLGLTLAHRLAQAGHAVAVFEAADRLGGLASAWTLGDVQWDRHYHVILQSDAALRALLAEIGLEDQIEWVQTRTGFYTDGDFHRLSNTIEFLRFPPLGLWDKARLAATILRAARLRDGRSLEQIPVVDWLRRWSGQRTLERLWLPLLRAKLGDNYRVASAAFIWAIIARMYAARRSGMKRELFGYVPGGYARILERFAEVLGAEGTRLVLGGAVRRVTAAADGRVSVALADGREETFDRVVVTAAAPLAARLCPDLEASAQARLAALRYQGIVCASLLLRRPLSEFYVTNITDAWVPFTAVIGMSNVVAARHLGGHALVYLPKYLAADDPAFARSDADVEEEFLAALERMYPAFRRADVLAFRLSRVRHVLPIPTLHYSAGLPPMRTALPGVYLVNSAHIVNGTLNVDETVALAERALATLCGAAPQPP